MANPITIKAKLVAKNNDMYTTCVFENLEDENGHTKYLMLTQCPNWGSKLPEIGTEGFLTYEHVKAGEPFIRKMTNVKDFYRYNASYYVSFVEIPSTNTQIYTF